MISEKNSYSPSNCHEKQINKSAKNKKKIADQASLIQMENCKPAISTTPSIQTLYRWL